MKAAFILLSFIGIEIIIGLNYGLDAVNNTKWPLCFIYAVGILWAEFRKQET